MIYHLDHDTGIAFFTDNPIPQMGFQILFDDSLTTEEFETEMYEEKRPVVLVFPYDVANEKYEAPIGISNMSSSPYSEIVEETTIYSIMYIMNINDLNVLNDPPFKWYNGKIVVYNSLEKDYLLSTDGLPELSEDVIMQYAPWSENTPEVNSGTGDS